jgi:ABC-type nitrate/sulfonate/bicarbonate transport system substrate-binding protein
LRTLTRRASLRAGSAAFATAIVAPGILTSAGCQALSPVGSPAKVTVALDWYPWSNHTGLYLAKDRGYYGAEQLDVTIYVPSNPEDVLKLVGSGKDTVGISYETDVLFARAEGVPVVSIAALVQQPLNSIMALKSSGITRPKQLEGRKVGTAGLPSDDAFLTTMMAADGADARKADVIGVGYDLLPALLGAKVDAIVGGYWVHESIVAEIKGQPVNVMKVQDWGVPPYFELVLVASEATVKAQPDLLKRFVRATTKGYLDANRDQQSALDSLFKAAPETDRELEQRGIKLLAPLWLDDKGAFGIQTSERWKAYSDWLKEQGLLKADVDPAQAFTAQFTAQ